MGKIELTELYKAQAALDAEIASLHDASYAKTHDKRTLALLVEIGEFANATRCFKYWSLKPSESRERVLDEYADGLHFFLSLGIDIGAGKMSYNLTKHEKDLTCQVLTVYTRLADFVKRPEERTYVRAFQSFLNILPLLHVRWKSAEEAYYKKLGENYSRQQNHY